MNCERKRKAIWLPHCHLIFLYKTGNLCICGLDWKCKGCDLFYSRRILILFVVSLKSYTWLEVELVYCIIILRRSVLYDWIKKIKRTPFWFSCVSIMEHYIIIIILFVSSTSVYVWLFEPCQPAWLPLMEFLLATVLNFFLQVCQSALVMDSPFLKSFL